MKIATAFGLVAVAQGNNAISKVLELLGNLQAEVQAENAEQESQYKTFSDWCFAENDATNDAIEDGGRALERAEAQIEEFSGDVAAADAKIAELAPQIAADEASLQESRDLCAKDRADFDKQLAELAEVIDTLSRASHILTSAGLGLPQIKAAMAQIAASVGTVLKGASIQSDNARKLNALLEESESEDDEDPFGKPQVKAYESKSGAIMDVLAQLKIEAEKQLREAQMAKMQANHACEMTHQSLTDALKAANDDLAEQKMQKGANGDALGKAQKDQAQYAKTLAEDKKYLSELTVMCQQKATEWKALQTCNREQLNVLKIGIETLSGEDFTKAVQDKFLQISSKDDVRQEVARVLQKWAKKTHSTGLAQLAVRTRVGDDPFGKVRKLISDMINRLELQGHKEATKNEYCISETKKTTADRNRKMSRSDQLSTRVDGAKAEIAMLKSETAEIAGEISDMTRAMGEMTALRQKEAAAYAKFKAEMQLSEQQVSSAVETLQNEFSANPALIQASQPKYSGEIFSGQCVKKVDGASGIIGILETTLADFARATAEAETAENLAGNQFDKFKQEYEVNLASKTSEKKGKEAETATVTALLADVQSDYESNQDELNAVLGTLEKLRNQCEHKPQTFAERAAKRQQEIEGLREALNILETETAGAFLQKRAIAQHI